MPFADYSSLMLSNGSMIKLKSTFVSEGTLPAGSTWQMNPIPGYAIHEGNGWSHCKTPGPGCRCQAAGGSICPTRTLSTRRTWGRGFAPVSGRPT